MAVTEVVQAADECDFSPLDGLHLVDVNTHRQYCSRQLNVLLSANIVFKGNPALPPSARVHTDPQMSWKVLEFHCSEFQAWKVLEKGIGPGKPRKFLEF